MKFRPQLAFVIIPTLSLFAHHQVARSASGGSPLQRGIIEVDKGKYSEPNQTKKLVDNAIKQNSNLAEAYLERSNIKRRLGENREASEVISTANKLIRLDPKNHQALLDRGRAFYHLKNYSAALTDFNAINNIPSNDYWSYYWRGAAYIQLDNAHFQQAILDLDRAVFLWKSSTNKDNLLVGYSLYSMRGAAKICAIQLPAAITDFKQALKLAQKEGNLERIESAKQTIEQLERYLTFAVFLMTILLLIVIIHCNKVAIYQQQKARSSAHHLN
jgi:tetratricopeptide (TPR) repeat protein